ncbi:GxxExxY protein [candidate division KSB1 bacterium]
MDENELAKIIVDCCFRIHKNTGPGLLESVYEELLLYELQEQKLECERQVDLSLNYKDIKIEKGFRADLLVDNKVIVEIKSVENLLPVHKKQLLTYLKLSGKKLGLLVNFNVDLIKDGITRIVNNL